MRLLILCVVVLALFACGQSEDGQSASEVDDVVDAATAEAEDIVDRARSGQAPKERAEGTDECAVFESGMVIELFEVDQASVEYHRSIPSKRAGHVVCRAIWERSGPPYQNEVSVTLLSNEFSTADEAVVALEQNVQTLAKGMTITVGGKEHTRKTEFGDWMDGVGDKAIFTSKGALMVAGKARLMTVGVKAMDDEAQDREKAIELAQRLLDQL